MTNPAFTLTLSRGTFTITNIDDVIYVAGLYLLVVTPCQQVFATCNPGSLLEGQNFGQLTQNCPIKSVRSKMDVDVLIRLHPFLLTVQDTCQEQWLLAGNMVSIRVCGATQPQAAYVRIHFESQSS